MFDNFINWEFLELWKVPINAFSTTLGFHKELDDAKFKDIEKKALDSIKMTCEPQHGKAKLIDKQEIIDRVDRMFKECMKND